MGDAQAEKILSTFVRIVADNTGNSFIRRLHVSSDVGKGEISVQEKSVTVCPSFISPETDLPKLAGRILALCKAFDEREALERERYILELERLLLTNFTRLAMRDSERAREILNLMEQELGQM